MIDETTTLDALLAAVAAEDGTVDLSGAVLRSGWESLVVETRDGWILRFPRPHVDFDRELSILRQLSGRLSAPIPQVEWVGQHTRFAAYRKLCGFTFDAHAYERSSQVRRRTTARSLAAFLAAMHTTLTPAEIDNLEIPAPVQAPVSERIAARLDEIPDRARPPVEMLLEAFESTWENDSVPGPLVVLHNDFGTSNIVLDCPAGKLAGVWDFSCVQMGRASSDLRYFADQPWDLLYRIASEYEELTRYPMGTRAAVLSHRVEVVCDHLELGTTDELSAAVAEWQAVSV